MLTADNPAAPKKLIRFNMKERTYKLEPMVDNVCRQIPQSLYSC